MVLNWDETTRKTFIRPKNKGVRFRLRISTRYICLFTSTLNFRKLPTGLLLQENKKEDGEDVQEQDQKQEGAEKENERVIVRYTV